MFHCHHLVLSDCESVFLAVAAGVIEVGRRQEAAQSCQFVVESFFVWWVFTLPLSVKRQLVVLLPSKPIWKYENLPSYLQIVRKLRLVV